MGTSQGRESVGKNTVLLHKVPEGDKIIAMLWRGERILSDRSLGGEAQLQNCVAEGGLLWFSCI
jgi:hypothetical protein